VLCGHCVEACLVDAMRMDVDQVELASYTRSAMIWDLKALLQDKK